MSSKAPKRPSAPKKKAAKKTSGNRKTSGKKKPTRRVVKKPKKKAAEKKAQMPKKADAKVEVMEVSPHSEEINEVVQWINSKVNTSVHKACVEIGNYLLGKFFGGSVESFRSHNPNKNASMRALAQREDLPLSVTSLYNYIGLAIQQKEIGGQVEAYKELGHTHKILMLPLKDTEKKSKLAEKAVKDGLSSRKFKELVDEARKAEVGETTRGRPEKNAILFTLDHIEKILSAREIGDEHYESLKEEGEIIAVLEKAEALLAQLTAVVSTLRRRKPKPRTAEAEG